MLKTTEHGLPQVDAAPALPDGSARAIVIDAHAPSRIGIAALLEGQPWIERCLQAADSQGAVGLVRRHRPDVALLDISQTGPFAGTVTATIRLAHPGIHVLLVSRCSSSAGAPATSLGAVGFLPAGTSGEEIVEAARSAILTGAPDLPPATSSVAPVLTDREREILILLGTGATNREIAAHLHLGPDSVKKSATGLYRKLGVRNRTEAVRRAAAALLD
ncbi:MAG TPA: response regulator transcription factor [Solirubrobacterales bacterium]|jgi:two-component system response regulator DesR